MRVGARQLSLGRGYPTDPCLAAKQRDGQRRREPQPDGESTCTATPTAPDQCAPGGITLQGSAVTLEATYPCELGLFGFNSPAPCTRRQRSRSSEAAVASAIRREDGQALIIMALTLVVMLGFAGLVVDIGRAYLAQRQLQTAVDAAALAGGQSLPNSTAAQTQALDYSATGLAGNAHPKSMAALGADGDLQVPGVQRHRRAVHEGSGRRDDHEPVQGLDPRLRRAGGRATSAATRSR